MAETNIRLKGKAFFEAYFGIQPTEKQSKEILQKMELKRLLYSKQKEEANELGEFIYGKPDFFYLFLHDEIFLEKVDEARKGNIEEVLKNESIILSQGEISQRLHYDHSDRRFIYMDGSEGYGFHDLISLIKLDDVYHHLFEKAILSHFEEQSGNLFGSLNRFIDMYNSDLRSIFFQTTGKYPYSKKDFCLNLGTRLILEAQMTGVEFKVVSDEILNWTINMVSKISSSRGGEAYSPDGYDIITLPEYEWSNKEQKLSLKEAEVRFKYSLLMKAIPARQESRSVSFYIL